MRTILFWDFDGTLAEAPHIWSNTLHRLLLEAAPDCGVTLAAIRQYTARIFPWDTPDDDHESGIRRLVALYGGAVSMTYRALGVTEDQARRRVRRTALSARHCKLLSVPGRSRHACTLPGVGI